MAEEESQRPADALEAEAGAGKAASPQQENPLINIMVNVLIPVVALSFLSKDLGKPWHLGPLWGMIIAVAFPIVYGSYDLITKRKVNFFSILGIVSVLLTGGITLQVWNEDDSVKPYAARLFAIKEAMIPLIFGITILASNWTAKPLVRVFLYNPDLFDIRRIEKAVKAKNETIRYEKLLFSTTIIMSLSFFLSSVMNYFLALHFLEGVTSRVEYNAAIGKLTGWGFLVIGVPCMLIWILAFWRLVVQLKNMTGLKTEQLTIPR